MEGYMNQDTWSGVDTYFTERLIPADPTLESVLRESNAAGLPQINVAPNQGKLLQLLAQMQGARAILEIGTLGGYSTIWLARALPKDGRMLTLEANPAHAAVAKANLARAGLAQVVQVRVGKAADTLAQLVQEGAAPFDFIFIDANKDSMPDYLEWSLKLSHPGTAIVCDNVVRNGVVADPTSTNRDIIGIRRFFDLMSQNPRLSATAVQTVGSKGYDGFSLAIVNY
jgi:predicted O-methyltransferase YrrM